MQVKRNILLNPGPATTTDSVKHAQVVSDICPREKEFGDMLAWIQDSLVEFAGSKTRNTAVLIGGSGTAAVEMTINSVVPDNGAICIVNNGAYGERMVKIAKVYNLEIVEFNSSDSAEINYTQLEKEINASEKKLAKQGRTLSHLAMVHHETTSGLLNNTEKIGAMCKKHGLSFILDAMSSYGAMQIDMDTDNIDFLVCSSNKNLQAMAGIGIVICNRKALEQSKKVKMRSLYLNLYDQYTYFNKTHQFRFTPPVQTLYALKQAIDETLAEGIANRYKRYRESYKLLRKEMEAKGFKVLVDDTHSSGFITTFFEPKDPKYSFNEMHDYLYKRGYTIYPGKVSKAKTFRIANIGDINREDIYNFLHELQNYLYEKDIKAI